MSDLKKYISKRRAVDKKFAENFDEGYEDFKLSIVLKQMREDAGLTQESLAKKLHTKKTAISRIEKQSKDIKVSTLIRFAKALNRRVSIRFRKVA